MNRTIWKPSNIYLTAKLGNNVSVGAFSEIGNKVVIGNNVRIGAFAFIPEGFTIEDDVFIGPRFTGTNDKYPPSGKENWDKTIIRKGARIGAGVTVICGVEIGEKSLIGAGSVVTKNIPEGETWCGVPCCPINSINDYWLLGLIEGESCFTVSNNKNGKDKKMYNGFNFSLEMAESKSFFEVLQKELGGHIYKRKRENRPSHWKQNYILNIRDTSSLIKLIQRLDNLKWRTKKREQFDNFKRILFEYKDLKYGEKHLNTVPCRKLEKDNGTL